MRSLSHNLLLFPNRRRSSLVPLPWWACSPGNGGKTKFPEFTPNHLCGRKTNDTDNDDATDFGLPDDIAESPSAFISDILTPDLTATGLPDPGEALSVSLSKIPDRSNFVPSKDFGSEESRMLRGVDKASNAETKDESTDLLRRLVELEEAKVDNVLVLESAGL